MWTQMLVWSLHGYVGDMVQSFYTAHWNGDFILSAIQMQIWRKDFVWLQFFRLRVGPNWPISSNPKM